MLHIQTGRCFERYVRWGGNTNRMPLRYFKLRHEPVHQQIRFLKIQAAF